MHTKQETITRLHQLLKQHDLLTQTDVSHPTKAQVLAALQQLARTHQLLDAWEPTRSIGLFGNLKLKVVQKIKNLTINVINPSARKQEQFNLMIVEAISILIEDQE